MANKLKQQVMSGDWLLFRSADGCTDPITAAITVAGKSPWYHAGMAGWWDDELMCVETKQFIGGRAVSVKTLLDAYPNDAIDVFHVRYNRYRRHDAISAMRALTGRSYGWLSLLRATLTHVIGLRWFIRPTNDDRLNGSLPFCSQAVSRASRAGGLDPAHSLSDGFTDPGTLAHVSDALVQHIGTLVLVNGSIELRPEEGKECIPA